MVPDGAAGWPGRLRTPKDNRGAETVEIDGLPIVSIAIDEIDEELRPASLMRARLDPEALERYEPVLDRLPPVKLARDPEAEKLWVVDGFHTITSHRNCGKKRVKAVIWCEGPYNVAWQEAALQNQEHGLPVTNADKRARVANAVAYLEATQPRKGKDRWPWSERRLAKFCGVSNAFVNKLGVLGNAKSNDDHVINSDVLTVNTSSDIDDEDVGSDEDLATRTDSMGRQQPARKPRFEPRGRRAAAGLGEQWAVIQDWLEGQVDQCQGEERKLLLRNIHDWVALTLGGGECTVMLTRK
jgi:hypothetical protein